VKTVAVRTPRDQGRVSQTLHFAVIALLVSLVGNREDLVALHHLPVGMAFLTDLGMKFLPECDGFGLLSLQEWDLVQPMAIRAGGRIGVSSQDRLAVDALAETIIGMATRAFLDHTGLIPFPRGGLVDILVAILALNIVDKVGARIMFGPFFFMTAVARDGLGVDPCSLCLDMELDICDVPVTTIARIGSVDRLGELLLIDLFVAAQTFGAVETLVAIFPSLDKSLLLLFRGPLRCSRSRGFGDLLFRCRLEAHTVCKLHERVVPGEKERMP